MEASIDWRIVRRIWWDGRNQRFNHLRVTEQAELPFARIVLFVSSALRQSVLLLTSELKSRNCPVIEFVLGLSGYYPWANNKAAKGRERP